MATRYADRAFISINGARLVDVQSASLRQNFNARPVPSMTPDGFNRGFVQGNREIDIAVTLAVQNALARPKLEEINFTDNDVQITFQCGAELFTATGLFIRDVSDDSSGVGEEVKTSFNFSALRLLDGTGNSSLFNIDLT